MGVPVSGIDKGPPSWIRCLTWETDRVPYEQITVVRLQGNAGVHADC